MRLVMLPLEVYFFDLIIKTVESIKGKMYYSTNKRYYRDLGQEPVCDYLTPCLKSLLCPCCLPWLPLVLF